MKQRVGKIVLLAAVSLGIVGVIFMNIANAVNQTISNGNRSRMDSFATQFQNIADKYENYDVSSDETQFAIINFLSMLPEESRASSNIVIANGSGNIVYRSADKHLIPGTAKLNMAWNSKYAVMQDLATGQEVWVNHTCSVVGNYSTQQEVKFTEIGVVNVAVSLEELLESDGELGRNAQSYVSILPVVKDNAQHYVFWFRDGGADEYIYPLLYGNDSNADDILSVMGVIMILLYWLLLPVWVFLDARRRQTQPLPWALLVLLTNVVGLIVYWIVQTQNGKAPLPLACPACGKAVKKGYPYCPWCASPLVKGCRTCGKTLESGWTACPWCGKPIE